MEKSLNPKHEAFARDVALFGASVNDAYDRHVARPGSKPGARNGERWLAARQPILNRIQELSAAAMEKAAELAGVDRARALAEQARIAYSNILDFIEIDAEGVAKMKAMTDIPRDKAAAIQSISYDSNGRLRLKLHDKVGALATLLRATEPKAAPAEDDDVAVPADQVARWDDPPNVGARPN
jgi:hypothetical protein